ncbi:hypothetical protein [Tardiphaga robiniae]|uniref:Uncharacterized protein n=1 Tax=Tardiphaga robiniae TaxID=943830 RepID=A0A7G6TXH1_9BRAD|nr:hypothetical protein [Tardiphaga robiniae]QND71453.1 hypothetical protein HB776_09545 [Tardiphaga robiniae]
MQKLSLSQAGTPFWQVSRRRDPRPPTMYQPSSKSSASHFGEYHCAAFEIAQRRLFFIELVSRRMIELSIIDLWTSKILFSDRESMLVVTQKERLKARRKTTA